MADDAVDQALVERVRRGERKAFDLLVEKYQHRVAHLVARYVRDSGDTEDVAQEVFIKAYRGLAHFRGDSAFYTWLYRIAVNTAKNHAAAAGRRAVDQSVDADEVWSHPAGSLLRDGATPEREALSDEIQTAVVRTVDELPEELREALILREVDGLTYQDISAVMECPIGTVRSRIFRARDAIERSLAPLLDETGTRSHET